MRDPDVQTLLDAAKPGWRWEPTLLEVTDGRPRVFTGMQMRARMALGLGPRRAWRVLQVVQRAEVSQAMEKPFYSKRRGFLKGAAVFAGGLLLPVAAQAQSTASGTGSNQTEWERIPHAEAAALVAATRSSEYYQTFTTSLAPQFAAEKDTALLGRGKVAFVALPVTTRGKANGGAFAAVVDRNLRQVKQAIAWTIEDTVDGQHHARVWSDGQIILDATFDDSGTVVSGWMNNLQGGTQDITGQNYVAEGRKAVDDLVSSISARTDGVSTQSSSYEGLTNCLANFGVPLYLLALIGAICGVACALTAGVGCFLCAPGVLGAFIGVGAACLTICGYTVPG